VNEPALQRKVSPAIVAYVLWAFVFLGWGSDILNRLPPRFVPSPSARLYLLSEYLSMSGLVFVGMSPFLALLALAKVSDADLVGSTRKKVALRIVAIAVVLVSFAEALRTCNPH
jgi:hypothetical protein